MKMFRVKVSSLAVLLRSRDGVVSISTIEICTNDIDSDQQSEPGNPIRVTFGGTS